MFGALSVISVVVGSTLAFAAKWNPSRTATMETAAGALLLIGLGLLGSALPHLA